MSLSISPIKSSCVAVILLPKLLRHADRNSMAFSIESRVPFLTIDLADYL